jgi:hypothetical protein
LGRSRLEPGCRTRRRINTHKSRKEAANMRFLTAVAGYRLLNHIYTQRRCKREPENKLVDINIGILGYLIAWF